jgi:hypothetical protein
MFDTGYAIDRFYEGLPAASLRSKNLFAFWGEFVIASASLSCLFHPPPLNPATSFKPIKEWIERGDIETECPIGTSFYQFADFIPVSRSVFDKGED